MSCPAGAGRERLAIRTRRVEGPPVVAIRVWLRGGSRAEATPGLALLAGRGLAEGSRRRDWRRLAAELDGRGAALAGGADGEAQMLAIDGLAADWEELLALAAELVLEPAFPEARLAWLRRQAASELESLGDQPQVRTGLAFMDQLYHPHPLARPLQGTAAALETIGVEGCRAHHRDALERGIIVSVAGRLDAARVAERATALFASAAGPAAPTAEPPAPAGTAEPLRRVTLDGDARAQAHLFCGALTVTRSAADFPPLAVLGVILGAGSGLAGRLPTRLRERQALAYSCQTGTIYGAGLDRGRFVVYLGTGPERVAAARAAIVEELERLLADGVSDRELAGARRYLIGREPFRRETARQWAALMAESELLGLPLDSLERALETWRGVDRDALERAARRLDPAQMKSCVGLPSGA